MSVRSGQSVTVLFSTARFDTGAATNGDSTPAGTLYVNGTADAASVTVTNITTGLYKAAVTLPTLAVGDVVSLRIDATVNSVAGKAVVWQDTKDVVISSAGAADADAKAVNGVSTSPVTTVNANLGTTQPVNFHGTGATAYAKVDIKELDDQAASYKTGTCQSGSTSTTIKLESTASSTNGNYKWRKIRIVGGTGNGQTNILKDDYNGTTKVVSVLHPWGVTPDSTTEYEIEDTADTNLRLWMDEAPSVLLGSLVQASATQPSGAVYDCNPVSVLGTPLTEVTPGDLAAAWSLVGTVNGVPTHLVGVAPFGIVRNSFDYDTGQRAPRTGTFTSVSGTNAGNETVAGVSRGYFFLEDSWGNNADVIGCNLQISNGNGALGSSHGVLGFTYIPGGASGLKCKLLLDRPWGTIPSGTITYNLLNEHVNQFLGVGVNNYPNGSLGDTLADLQDPGEQTGLPTKTGGFVRRLFEKVSNKRTRNRTTGAVNLRNAADSGNLVTATQSTVSSTDTISADS